MLKVAVFNFKGGTGKSTTVINLGLVLQVPSKGYYLSILMVNVPCPLAWDWMEICQQP